MKKIITLISVIFLLSVFSIEAVGQTAGDYRSVMTGDWGVAATWETYNGATWVGAGTPPDNTSGIITIQFGHMVTVTTSVIIDQTDVNAGGQLFINPGVMLEVEDDGTAAFDLNINGSCSVLGTIRKNQGAVINTISSAALNFLAGSTYEHNNTTSVGNIPTSTWNPASNCNFIGYTSFSGSPGFGNNFGQGFGNVNWNCPNQAGNINFAGYFTTVNGSFHVISTGTAELRLCGATSPVLTIGQDFIIDGGTFVMTNGTGLPEINLTGNFIHNNGNLTVTGSGGGTLNFVANGTQMILINPATTLHAGDIRYAVKNSGGQGPSTLEFGDDITVIQNDSLAATFDLEPGAAVILRHPGGIAQNGNSGCVQVGGNRTFSTDAHYTYQGGNPQITGTGLPSVLYASLTINNGTPLAVGGVTFSQATLMTGATSTLNLNTGKFLTDNVNLLSLDTDVLINGGSTASYVDGPLRRFTNSVLEWFFPVGDTDEYKPAGVFPQSATLSDFTIEAFHQTPPNNTSIGGNPGQICSVSNVEYWSVTGTSASEIKLYWHAYSGINETQLQICNNLEVAHYDGNTNLWEPKGNSLTDFIADFVVSGTFSANYNTTLHTFGLGCTVSAVLNSVIQPTCGLNNGAIDVTVSGGSSPYTYSWNNGASTEDLTGVGGGNYVLYVTDAGGCSDTLSVSLNITTGVSASAVITPPSCGQTNGAIDVTVTGGTQPLIYTWNTGANTEDLSGIGSGNYIFVVTDLAGCLDTLTLVVPGSGALTAVNDTAAICGPGGSIDIAVLLNDIGGIDTSSLVVAIAPPVTDGTAVVNPDGTITFTPGVGFVLGTTFVYQITDTSGCAATATVNILNGLLLTASITPSGTVSICQGDSITLTSNSPFNNVWSTGETTQSIVTDTAGVYTVTVTAGGCSSTAPPTTVVVNPIPSTPVITVSGPTTFCQGGSVQLSSSSTLNNTWSTGDTTQSVLINTTGIYTVTVDSLGCSSSPSAPVSVTVNSLPAAPVITPSGPTTFCQGDSVTLTASPSADIIWSTGDTTASVTVYNSGTYSVTFTDANGCSSSSSVPVTVISNPSTPTITAGGPLTFCQGGSVTLTSSAATGNTWSPGGQNTQTITVNTSGTYSVTVGALGCSATSLPVSVTVNPAPAVPVISASGPLTFCQGSSVTLTSSAATGNLWSPGGQNTQSIVVNTSGAYSVTVTGANGCTSVSAISAVTVNANPPMPVITSSGPTTICSGNSVTLTSSAASGNLWSPGGQNTQSITASSAGNYSVTVTNASGCSSTSSVTNVSVLASPAAPTVTPGGATTFCSGGNVTLLSSYASGNTWSPNGQTTPSIVVSASGNYSVTHTDANGCSATSSPVSVTVNPLPQTPQITASGPLTFCDGGSVTLTSSAASGNIWSTGDNTQSITVTNSGSFNVVVTDVNGCSATSASVSVTVNPNPNVPVISAGGPISFCNGGSVTLTSSEPSGNFWSSGQSSNAITVTTGGTYEVTATNPFGCSATSAPVTVTVNPVPSAPVISSNGGLILCSNGNVTLSSSQNTGNTWSTGDTTSTLTVNSPGTYTVTYTSPDGCASAPASVSVSQLAPLNATAFTLNDADCGLSNGSASSSATGGSGSYTYLWNSNPPQSGQTATGLPAGTYMVTVSDATNPACVASANTTIGGGSAVNITTTPDGSTSVCEGGDIPLMGIGGASYIWLKDGNPVGTGTFLIVSQPGSYQAIGFSGAGATGCPDTSASVIVTQIPVPVANIFPIGPTEVCYETPVTLLAQPNVFSSVQWLSYGQPTLSTGDTLVTFNTGEYSYIATNSCGSDTSAVIYVDVHTKPIADFYFNPNPGYAGDPVSFTDQSIHAAVWNWDFGNGAGSSTTQNPEYIYLSPGVYNVTMIIQDDIGCADTVSKLVPVDVRGVDGEVFIPNSFTPNGDGEHDFFTVQYGGITLSSLQIFDRWGAKVFETNSPTDTWDGKNMNGNPCNPGVYYYNLTGKDSNNDKAVLKGWVMLAK